MSEITLRRRTLLAGAGATAALSTVDLPGAHAAPGATSLPTEAAAGTRFVSGTDFAVAASPDGKRLAVDLLGVLWVLPASGGMARRLTSDYFDIAQPHWRPDGKRIIFQSYRDGNFHLWSCTPDGTDFVQHTTGKYDHREPSYSPDGRSVVFSTDMDGSYNIGVLDLATGKHTLVVNGPDDEYEPTWSPDGARIAFVVANTKIDEVVVATGERRTLATLGAADVAHMPAYLPDGSDVAFHLFSAGANSLRLASGNTLVQGEEVFPLRPSFRADGSYHYTAGGRIRRRQLGAKTAASVGFTAAIAPKRANFRKTVRRFDAPGRFEVKGIQSPVLSADGKQLVFCALGDVYVMPVGGSAKKVFGEQWWFSHPEIGPSGEMLYSSDRSGTMNLWVRDLKTGRDRQLTKFADRAAVSGRWSPDGKEVAFLDQDGGLWVVDVANGAAQQVFDATFEPGRPSWSPDGKFITLSAVKPYTKRYREGLSKILVVNRATGEGRFVDPGPHRSLQTRGDDGPHWSPDGTKLLFAMENRAFVLPVDASGNPTGPAVKVNDEMTDALSWGPNGEICYLSAGKIRLQAKGKTRTLKHGLTWRNHTGAEELTVIHAGRMWDGESNQARSNVDILVKGQRIVGVEKHKARKGVKVIDASDRFVMPGLIEAHMHREMQGYEYGSRQQAMWLAWGITLGRGLSSPAYHMVHEREAVQSGQRIAPRYLATGEAVDGSRIYYNFMRPTISTAQVKQEMDRAAALEYDLVKCYVRLRTEEHNRVIQRAHRSGMQVSSHYHYPALAFGGDWTEHVGATNRFGYSRTITNVGSAYQDVIRPFIASQMKRTPTLFQSQVLYRNDTSLVEDERTQRLNPLWRLASLDKSVTAAKTEPPAPKEEHLANQVAQLIAMVRGGGVVTAGTDAPIDHVAISLHMNLRAMVKYGFTELEALKSVTSATGRALGQPIGRISKGCYADLVFVDGDPLADINDLANVTDVVTAGRHLTVHQVMAPYASPTETRNAVVRPNSVPKAGARTRRVGTVRAASAGAAGRAVKAQKVVQRVPQHSSSKQMWWNAPEVLADARKSCCKEC